MIPVSLRLAVILGTLVLVFSSASPVAAVETIAPASPTGLIGATGATGEAILSWQPSNDNGPGALRYLVMRGETPVAITGTTGWSDFAGGRLAGSYEYRVIAIDRAGNHSPASDPVSVVVAPELFPWAGAVYRHGDRTKPLIALTFDDCYDNANVARIMAILREHDVAATFFCVGTTVGGERTPLFQDMVRTFPLGNHTLKHADLNKTNEAATANTLTACTDRIEQSSGWGMPPIMRPPAGHANEAARARIAKTGLAVVKWDIDTRDWSRKSTIASVFAKALAAKNGSIVLFHSKNLTVAALPGIIKGLKLRGFGFQTVPDLLGIPWQPAP